MEICSECKSIVNDELTGNVIGAKFYCDECIDKLFFYCNSCEEWRVNNDKHNIDMEIICIDCFYDNYQTCGKCGLIIHMDNGEVRYYENYDGCLCNDCYSDEMFYCEHCDNDIVMDTDEPRLLDGIYVCSTCYTEHLLNTTGLLKVLKDFIEFEREYPLPTPTLRLWIRGLLTDGFVCPCRIGSHNCNNNCPRNSKNCKGNAIYSLLKTIGYKRKFVRFYLLKHLSKIYSEQIGYIYDLHDLMESLKLEKFNPDD